MGCKAQLIGIVHKILLFFIKEHLGHCQLYPINLSSDSIRKLTGKDKTNEFFRLPKYWLGSGSVKNEYGSATLVLFLPAI